MGEACLRFSDAILGITKLPNKHDISDCQKKVRVNVL